MTMNLIAFEFDPFFIGSSVAIFVMVTVLLTIGLLFAAAKLVNSGKVKININGDDDKSLEVEAGTTLLNTLSSNGILLPSACGGGGSCGVCRCKVFDGGGDLVPTEESHITRGEARENWRLACQVKVKQDMDISIPEEIFGIKKWEATVVRNYNVASFIKEFVVVLYFEKS